MLHLHARHFTVAGRLGARTIGANALDDEINLDLASPGELQRGLEMIALHELPVQANEHHVIAAGAELDRLPRLDLYAAREGTHLHHAVVHAHFVDLKSACNIAYTADQAFGRAASIGDLHIAAADAGTFRRSARP